MRSRACHSGSPHRRDRQLALQPWEPSWEPFAGDSCGRLWTPMEWKACHSGPCERLWTPMDTAWRSTDQKVGGSNPSGRAERRPLLCRGFRLSTADVDAARPVSAPRLVRQSAAKRSPPDDTNSKHGAKTKASPTPQQPGKQQCWPLTTPTDPACGSAECCRLSGTPGLGVRGGVVRPVWESSPSMPPLLGDFRLWSACLGWWHRVGTASRRRGRERRSVKIGVAVAAVRT